MSMQEVKINIGRTCKKIYAGRYNTKPKGIKGVKLAQEIQAEAAIIVNIKDYSVPDIMYLRDKLIDVITLLQKEDIYIGCMGGIGRTGLVLSILYKIEMVIKKHSIILWCLRHIPSAGNIFVNHYLNTKDYGNAAIVDIRYYYNIHAVETEQQEKYVIAFDVIPVIKALIKTKVI